MKTPIETVLAMELIAVGAKSPSSKAADAEFKGQAGTLRLPLTQDQARALATRLYTKVNLRVIVDAEDAEDKPAIRIHTIGGVEDLCPGGIRGSGSDTDDDAY